jgi:hypothetical protein
MDDMNVRMQCLQLANQFVMYSAGTEAAAKTPDAVLVAAEKLYNWVKGV